MYLGNNKRDLINGLESVNNFINRGKFDIALNILNDLERKYNDFDIIRFKSRIYTFNKDYKKALNCLNKLDEDRIYFNKVALNLFLNRRHELIRLFDKYFHRDNHLTGDPEVVHTYYILKTYLLKYFNFEVTDTTNFSYDALQIYNYSEERLIDHLNNIYKGNYFKFNNGIDYNKLVSDINTIINNNIDDYMFVRMHKTYMIKYPNIGYTADGDICNYIKVITNIVTNEIIDIIPSNHPGNIKVLNYINPNEVKKNIKTLSGIERFNKRYNKK